MLPGRGRRCIGNVRPRAIPAPASMLARVIMEAAATAGVVTTMVAADGVTRIPATRIGRTTIHIGQVATAIMALNRMRTMGVPTRTTNQGMATTQLWLHRCSAAWLSSATMMA